MGWVGIFIALLPLVLVYALTKLKLSYIDIQKAREDHKNDFPQAVLP
jgi:hypothetical protein